MTLRFSPAPLSTHSATPPTHPAKAAMAAAPHDGFDHAAIPNDDALITYRGQECPMGQRPPYVGGRQGPRAPRRQGPPRDKGRHRPWLTKGVGHEERVAMGQRGRSGRGCRRAKGRRECPRAKGPGKFPWSKVPTQPGT